jgi:hypothetical protein
MKKAKKFSIKNHVEKTLRASFKKTPLYNEAKRLAKEEYFEKSKNGKLVRRVRYKCAKCGRYFKDGGGEIAVDHIEPVISLNDGFTNFDEYIKRLFCDQSNLQVLCNYKGEREGIKSCHKIKTAEERAISALNKKQKRKNHMFYNQVFKVKVWAVLEDLPKKLNSEIIEFFKEAEAHIVEWPAKTFIKTLENLKSKGWTHEFEKDSVGRVILSPQMLNIAFVEHLRTLNDQAMISNTVSKPIHYINREIKTDADYERIFNEMMEVFDPISLSMAFNIGKLCHLDGQRQVKVFVSNGPIPKQILTKLAENIVTIKPEGGVVNTLKLKTEDIIKQITSTITQLI